MAQVDHVSGIALSVSLGQGDLGWRDACLGIGFSRVRRVMSGPCLCDRKMDTLPAVFGPGHGLLVVPQAQAGETVLWQHPPQSVLGCSEKWADPLSLLQRENRLQIQTPMILRSVRNEPVYASKR